MQDSWPQLKSDSISWRKTEKISQCTDAMACREFILPRDEDTSEQKGWIRVNTKIGPVLEVTTCCLQGKAGVDTWVSISHGLNTFVTNLDNNEQETTEMQFEDYALKLNASVVASRSKAKAKPQGRNSVSSSTRTIPIGERTWTYSEAQDYLPIDYPVSKQLSSLLRHGSLPRNNDGAERLNFVE